MYVIFSQYSFKNLLKFSFFPGLKTFMCPSVWRSSYYVSVVYFQFDSIVAGEHILYDFKFYNVVKILFMAHKCSQSLSCVQLFVTSWTIACQGPLFMGFSRQEYWSRLPFPSPQDLPNPEIEPRFPELQTDSLPCELQGIRYCSLFGLFW